MSRLGYQNTVQSDLQVSYNQLADYIHDLSHAIHTYPPFAELGLKKDGVYQQMNTNVLQIENEYYGLIRPKQTIQRVEYIEMRCVDLNPFTPTGIDSPTAHFLEVFALHSLLSDSPHFEAAEYAELAIRQEQMVEQGRKPELHIDMNASATDFKASALRSVVLLQKMKCFSITQQHNFDI